MTDIQNLETLLNAGRDSRGILKAMRELSPELDISLLDNFHPCLMYIFSRLQNLSDYSELYELIPREHTIYEPLSKDSFNKLDEYLRTISPYVNIDVKMPNIDHEQIVNVISYQQSILPMKNAQFESPIDVDIVYGELPNVLNNRKYVLSSVLNLPYNQVYTKQLNYRHSRLIEETIMNSLISDNIYVTHTVKKMETFTSISDFVSQILYYFSVNADPEQVMLVLHSLLMFMDDYKQKFSYGVLKQLKLILNDPSNIDTSILKMSMWANNEDVQQLITPLPPRQLCDPDYIINKFLPLLQSNTEFPIVDTSPNCLLDMNIFLSAFPNYNKRRYYFSDEMYVMSEEISFEHDIPVSDECRRKFELLKRMINLNYSFEIVRDVIKTISFSLDECLSLMPFVLHFNGLMCSFLSSMICNYAAGLIITQNLQLMYSILRAVPKSFLSNNSDSMCNYVPVNKDILNLHMLYAPHLDIITPFSSRNYPEFLATMDNIKKLATSKAELYILCAQYMFNEWLVYIYLNVNKSLDPITELILCRFLLNQENLSSAEQNILSFISSSNKSQFTTNPLPLSYSSAYLNIYDFPQLPQDPSVFYTNLMSNGIDITCDIPQLLQYTNDIDPSVFAMYLNQN
jgi:hypothetical protein